jgi:hypothetical protein
VTDAAPGRPSEASPFPGRPFWTSPFQASTDQQDSADMTDPTLAAEPTESTDPIEPAEPIDRIEPADPIDKMDPAEPIDKIDPLEPMLRMDPSVFRMPPFSQPSHFASRPPTRSPTEVRPRDEGPGGCRTIGRSDPRPARPTILI